MGEYDDEGWSDRSEESVYLTCYPTGHILNSSMPIFQQCHAICVAVRKMSRRNAFHRVLHCSRQGFTIIQPQSLCYYTSCTHDQSLYYTQYLLRPLGRYATIRHRSIMSCILCCCMGHSVADWENNAQLVLQPRVCIFYKVQNIFCKLLCDPFNKPCSK